MSDEPVITNVRQEPDPHTRLTRLADVAMKAIEADPDYQKSDRVLVAIHDDEHPVGHGGLGTMGYDANRQLVNDLAAHLRSVLSA